VSRVVKSETSDGGKLTRHLCRCTRQSSAEAEGIPFLGAIPPVDSLPRGRELILGRSSMPSPASSYPFWVDEPGERIAEFSDCWLRRGTQPSHLGTTAGHMPRHEMTGSAAGTCWSVRYLLRSTCQMVRAFQLDRKRGLTRRNAFRRVTLVAAPALPAILPCEVQRTIDKSLSAHIVNCVQSHNQGSRPLIVPLVTFTISTRPARNIVSAQDGAPPVSVASRLQGAAR
jgi:hypothetical protein